MRTRSGRRRAAVLVSVVGTVLLAGALAFPLRASAHALLRSSDPPAGATLASAPAAVTLTFSETPDPRLSTVKVLDVQGRDQAAGPAEASPGEPATLRVALRSLGDGVFTVSWRTISAVDGHVAAGSFAFGVGVAPGTAASQPTATTGPSASPAATVARWLLYLGLVGLLGAGVVGAVVTVRPGPSLARYALVAWVVSAIGTAAVIALQWLDAGADPATLLGSSIATGALSRIATTVGTALATSLVVARGGFRGRAAIGARWPYAVLTFAAAGALLVDVLTGHAAAGPSSAVQVAIQWLHGASSGAWIGGLAALLLSVRGQPSDEKARMVRRFSTWAGVALVVVAATGVLRAVTQIGTLDALIGTDFGRVVIVKSALLAIVALLGATNRLRNVRSAARSLRGLRLAGSSEVAVGVAVLLATGLLVNLPPPSSAAGAAPAATASIVTTGHDFGTSVRVRLVVAPGSAGFNQFTAAVTDYDSGAAVNASAVALRFDLASRSGVGGSTLAMPSTAPGTFVASGGNLSLDGIWRITATVTAPSGTVEVPLVLATAVPEQHVHPTPGPPTIYTVLLSGGESVQVYLDPERPGKNQLHLTFLDAAGAELAVRGATVAVVPQGGEGSIVVPRLLEPGHFVADVDAPAGQLGVDVVTANGTAQLHAHLTVAVGS